MEENLRAYVWYYCCLAIPRDANASRKALGQLLRRGELFVHREAANAPTAPAGYSAYADSFWVRPHRWTEDRKEESKEENEDQSEAGRFLYPSQRLHRFLAAFANSSAFNTWRKDHQSRELDTGEHKILQGILGDKAPLRMAYEGVVLVGSKEKRGLTRIGVRQQTRYAKMTPAEIGVHLAYPPDIVTPAINAGATSTEFFNLIGGSLRYETTPFDRLANEVAVHYIAEASAAERTRPVALPVSSREDIETFLRDELQQIAGLAPRARPTELLIITRLEFEEAEDLCFKALPVLKRVRRLKLRLLAREQLDAHISGRPWLWSKYFGQERSFRVVLGDEATISEIGVSNPSASLPFIERAELEHVDRSAPATLLVGRPGAGKSAALRHLAKHLKGAMIVTDWHGAQSMEIGDERLIADFATTVASTGRTVAIVLDDIDTPERRQLVVNLVRRKLPAALLASATSPLAPDVPIQTVSLDIVPHQFRLALFRAAAAAKGIASDPDALEDADDDAMFTCATPREILRHVEQSKQLTKCSGIADLQHPYWRSRFAELSEPEHDVLVIVAILRRLGIPRVTIELLEEVFAKLQDVRRFEDVLDRITKKWVFWQHLDIVCTPILSDAFYISRHTGKGEELSAPARQVLRVVLTSELISDDFKKRLVDDTSLNLLLDNRPEELGLVLRTQVRFGVEVERVKSMAEEFLRVGAPEEARALMEQHFREYPDDYDAWTWPAADALVHQNMKNALWALREFLRGAEIHPEWAEVDDYDHAHPTPEYVHNFLNSFRHYLRILPEFQSLVAEVLPGSPWLHRMERMLKGFT